MANIEAKMTDQNTNENVAQKETNAKKGWKQALIFTLFSLSAGVIQIGTFTLLSEVVGWSFWPSHLISVTLSVIWNFTFNRKYTFKASNNVPIAMLLVAAYYAVFIPASVFGGNALEAIGWHALLVEALMMIINFVTEFVYQKFLVFNPKIVPDRKVKIEK